jgi:hypothetical protein
MGGYFILETNTMQKMTCRQCDKLEPRGCGKTCCEIDGIVVNDFDSKCKFTYEARLRFDEVKRQIGNIRNEQNT